MLEQQNSNKPIRKQFQEKQGKREKRSDVTKVNNMEGGSGTISRNQTEKQGKG